MFDTKIAQVAMLTKEIPQTRGRRDVLSRCVFIFVFAVLLCLPTAWAQTGQGIISGIVTDTAGASVAHAAVAIRNTATNVVINVKTNDTGYYEIRDLNPGNYEVAVTAAGFEKAVHPNIVLLADGHPSIDTTMKVGSANETVTVNGASPLIDTQTVSVGQVLTSEEMSALPNGQAPIWLAMLSPGVQSNYAQNYQLGGADPSWNGAGPQFGAYGRIGANEFSLDGAPNMANQRGQAINLSAEELGQTSVNITQFDSSVGHTYGISLNQTTKAGTNDLHGGIRYRRYDLRWFAMQHFQGSTYQARMTADNCAANPTSAACQLDQEQLGWPGTHLNYGDAGIGGPVFIPKIFDGRNRLFFFVGVTDSAPNNASSTTIAVPTGLEKTGNFSDLGPGTVPTGAVATLFRAAGCPAGTLFYGQYQIYNPYSVTMVNGHPSRLPFCGNIVPANLISRLPVVQAVNSYLPDPNSSSTTGNNFTYEQGTYASYRSVTNRYDYAVNNADHIFFRWTRAHFTQRDTNFLANNFGSYELDRWIPTGALGWSHILSPKTFVDVTVGATEWTGSDFNYPSLQQQKPSDLGLPTYVDQYAGGFAQFPILSISGYQMIGNNYYAPNHYRTLAIRGNLTTVRGTSTWRAGAEWRQQNVAGGGPIASQNAVGPSGQYNFDNTYVQQNDGTNNGTYPTTSTGLSYASFLLGIQSTAQVATVPATSRSNPYYAFYAGNTWRVNRKLTLVPGLRFEFEYGPTEKHNQQIVGWDPNAQLTIAPLVNAAYQKTLAGATAAQRAVLPTQLAVQGGPMYAGVNGASTRAWANNWRFLPRLGAAYSVNPTTVVRAGVGLYYDTLDALNESGTINTDGFTATTGPVQSSTVFGTDFVPGVSPLSNPFPSINGSRFVPAVGSSLGADYYTGSTATIGIYDQNRTPARSWRVQTSVEHQFGRSTVVQLAYVGSRTTNITLDGGANISRTYSAGFLTATAVPGSFYTGGNQPNSAANNLLNSKVPNPFYLASLSSLATSNPVLYNLLSKSSYITASTISVANLVRPYPQMSALRLYKSNGTSQFQEFQANLSKRMADGLVANFSYQKNYQLDRDFYENQFDPRPSLESSLISPPWRITSTWVYTLPLGRSHRFARDGWKSALFGGFQLSGSFEANPGTLLTFAGNGSPNGTPNIFFVGDPKSIRLSKTAYNTSGSTPTIYGFNTQAVNATSTSVNSIVTCTYTGTGFVLNSSCQPNSYNLRAFPRHVEGVRSQGLANWNANLGRTLNPNERFKVEARADILNVFNHQRVAMVGGAQMNPTNSQFGQITADNGTGRQIVLQMLMTF
jgi:Carboxypeptidase regulatory-like domain